MAATAEEPRPPWSVIEFALQRAATVSRSPILVGRSRHDRGEQLSADHSIRRLASIFRDLVRRPVRCRVTMARWM
jgi:hypothetical protein